MTKKKKTTVWHKKKGKFIPTNLVKPHSKSEKEEETSQSPTRESRRQAFAKDFLSQIKKGVRKRED